VITLFYLLVWPAPPKVFNLKIVGESMEGSKISASATVTGGTEGSSRVQWYKASSSEFKNEHELEALTPSRVSKVIPIYSLLLSLMHCSKLKPFLFVVYLVNVIKLNCNLLISH
jgi:hypothetical protein